MARDVLCMLQCKYTYKVIRHPFHFFLWFCYVPRASKLNHPITAFLGILSWVPSVTLSFNIDRRLFQKSTVTCFQSFGKLCSSADGGVKKSKSDAHIDMLRNYLLLLAVASSCNNEHLSKKKTERRRQQVFVHGAFHLPSILRIDLLSIHNRYTCILINWNNHAPW